MLKDGLIRQHSYSWQCRYTGLRKGNSSFIEIHNIYPLLSLPIESFSKDIARKASPCLKSTIYNLKSPNFYAFGIWCGYTLSTRFCFGQLKVNIGVDNIVIGKVFLCLLKYFFLAISGESPIVFVFCVIIGLELWKNISDFILLWGYIQYIFPTKKGKWKN